MKIVVVGTGYVGLVSAACFSDLGHTVACVDQDAAKIDGLRAGHIPIYEPGLKELVNANAAAGRLSFHHSINGALAGATVVVIAVGTPPRAADGHADLGDLYAAAEQIAVGLTHDAVLVIKSTVPVGTGDVVEAIVCTHAPTLSISVVSNPEFLREGSAIGDFQRPDRIVCGANDAKGREVLHDVYRPLGLDPGLLLFTDRRSSELIKYASNAFLATKIGFINEVANLCEAVGADVQHVSRGMGLDSRIGAKFLEAGPGYGGSCFPKDTLALVKAAGDVGIDMSIVAAVVASNNRRKSNMAERIITALGGSGQGKRVALLGLTFKPNTDDMRESPAIDIVEHLQAAGVSIAAFDPAGTHEPSRLLSEVDFATDAYAASCGADAVVIVTEWGVFRSLDLTRLAQVMRHPLLVDLRNVYDVDEATAAGLDYMSIGRPVRRRE